MTATSPITLHASAARTASGVGDAVDLGLGTHVALRLAVSAAAGATPTLVVAVETSPDDLVWRSLGTFGSVTAAGLAKLTLAGADQYVRARWTVGGVGPSFTFSLGGSASVVYATPEDLASHGLPEGWLAGVSAPDQAKALLAASGVVDSYLAGQFTLPLAAWGPEITRVVCHIASWDLMCRKGFDPEDPADGAIQTRYEAAIRWLEKVSAGRVVPPGVEDSTPDVDEMSAVAAGDPPRSW
jgi:phage gp36-like protein